ncbi:MAG: hypothetical protein ABL856_08670 [Gallionella sp.]
MEITPSGTPKQFDACGRSVTFVPLTIKRRHASKVLIAPPGEKNAKIKSSFDLPMIRTLGKAFYWQSLLDSGQASNVSELARQLKLEMGWVAEVLRLTMLAPDIVQAITEGRQPRQLNLHAVRGRQADVPVDWNEQRELFGFTPPVQS